MKTTCRTFLGGAATASLPVTAGACVAVTAIQAEAAPALIAENPDLLAAYARLQDAKAELRDAKDPLEWISEWSPTPEGGPFRWRGLTAGDISKELILSIKTSKTGTLASRDLNVMPLVTEALKAYTIPEIGPVVIDEDTGKPYLG